jgi:prolyl oligopeptidase
LDSDSHLKDQNIDTLPGRDVFRDRLKQLYNYERFSISVKKGGQYFYLHNSRLQNQQVLYVRDSVDSAGRVLIDPNNTVYFHAIGTPQAYDRLIHAPQISRTGCIP